MFTTQKLRAALVALVVLAAFVWSGCEHGGPVGPVDGGLRPTLTSIQDNVFNVHCAVSGCHLGASAPFGLDLSAGLAFGNAVQARSAEMPSLFRIDPGNPDQSYLVRKIEGAPGIVGERMPRGRPPLRPEEIGAIRDWIAAGAQNN